MCCIQCTCAQNDYISENEVCVGGGRFNNCNKVSLFLSDSQLRSTDSCFVCRKWGTYLTLYLTVSPSVCVTIDSAFPLSGLCIVTISYLTHFIVFPVLSPLSSFFVYSQPMCCCDNPTSVSVCLKLASQVGSYKRLILYVTFQFGYCWT